MLTFISSMDTTALRVCMPPATCVVGNAVGHVSAVPVANGTNGLLCRNESPVDTIIPIATSLLLVAAVWSDVHDDVGGGVVVGACAVNECVATGVTDTPLMHMSPTTSNVPSTESVSLAAAATSVVGNDVGGGVFVRAHESPVATTTPFNASRSLVTAALSAVVDDDVGSGVVVAANDVIKCLAIMVDGAALVHVSPVHTNMPSSASLSVAAVMSSVFDDNVDCGVAVGSNAVITCVAIVVTVAALVHVSPVTGNVLSTASVSLAAPVMQVVRDDVGGGIIVGARESPVATNT